MLDVRPPHTPAHTWKDAMPTPMRELLPRRAPRTWRDFLLRVAAIAVAALVVLGAIDLFESLRDVRTPRAAHSHPSTQPLSDTTP